MKEDWENIYYIGMFGTMGVAAVLLYYKPDTRCVSCSPFCRSGERSQEQHQREVARTRADRENTCATQHPNLGHSRGRQAYGREGHHADLHSLSGRPVNRAAPA